MSTALALLAVNPPPAFQAASAQDGVTTFGLRLALIISLAEEIRTRLDELHEEPRWDAGAGLDFYEEVKRFEVELIERALRDAGGNQRRAARLLRINTTTLNSKIKRYGLIVSKSFSEGEAERPPARRADS